MCIEKFHELGKAPVPVLNPGAAGGGDQPGPLLSLLLQPRLQGPRGRVDHVQAGGGVQEDAQALGGRVEDLQDQPGVFRLLDLSSRRGGANTGHAQSFLCFELNLI